MPVPRGDIDPSQQPIRPGTQVVEPRAEDPDAEDDPTVSIAPRGGGWGPWRRERGRDPRQRTLTVGATGQRLPIIYGRTQSGALVPYAAGVGSVLYIQYFICEGPISAIEDLGFGDAPSTTFLALGLRLGTDYNIYLGTHDQAIDPILTASQPAGVWKWRFPRIAYVSLKLNLGSAALENVDPMSFRCTPKGMLVNDHRSDSSMLHANRAYSNNSALCLVDFIRNPLFGLGASETEIEYDSWDEAADDCDATIATGLAAPGSAPTATHVNATGSIDFGSFQWGYTVVDATGVESTLSPASNTIVITAAMAGNRQVRLDDLNNVSGTAKKRVYRRKLSIDGTTWGSWKRVPGDVPDTRDFSGDTFPTSQLGGGSPETNTVKQFRTNCFIRGNGETVGSTVDMLRGTFTALVAYNNGKYQGYVDKVRTQTSFIYSASDIVGVPTITCADPAAAPTQVVLHYVNAALGFKPDDVTYPEQPALTGIERLDRIVQDEEYESIDSYDQAFRVCKWLYNRAVLAGTTITWRTGQKGVLPLPMARIRVGHARIGLSTTDVLLASVGPDSRDTWAMKGELEVTPDTDFHADPGTDTQVVDPPPPDDPPAPADDYYLLVTFNIDSIAGWSPE